MKNEGPSESFRFRHIPGSLYELRELPIRYRVSVNVKRVDSYLAHRPFAISGKALGIIGAHQERTAIEPDHAARRPAVHADALG